MEDQEQSYQSIHRRIIETLTLEIKDGRLRPHDCLPSDKELCERWQASRSTVRKAMDQLADRGIIYRVPGKGSFVAFRKISHPTSQLLSFSEKMKAQGLEVETKLIQQTTVEPDGDIASMLRLSSRDRVLMIQRLRIVLGEPMALQTSYIPKSIGWNLMGEDLASTSLNQLMHEKCNIFLSRSDVWIEAPILSRKEKKLLGSQSMPLFLALVSLTYDQNNNPVRFSRGVFRGDRVRLKISNSNVFELDCLQLQKNDRDIVHDN
jgi:GntR family transcriptional regulator